MKDWLSSAEGRQFSELLRSGCAEGGVETIVVPLPFAFVEQALTYTASVYDKNSRTYGYNHTTNSKFRISVVCDGSKLYMSFCCLSTGLTSNIYTKVENVRPFSVLLGGKHSKDAVTLQVKRQALQTNINSTNNSFVLYVSSEIFAIVHRKNNWRSILGNQNEIFTNIIQRKRISQGSQAGIGMLAYSGMRPFRAVGNESIIEYRRSKSVTINFGLTQQDLIDRIEPESIIGMKPEHGRWLLNKASASPTKEKGELIIHFKESTVGFCGASPASEQLSLEYGNHGSGRGRGKYRSYYNNGTEQTIVIQRESFATKDLNAMVNNCNEMYFGVSSNKSVIGWRYGDVLMLWEQDIMPTDVHPLLEEAAGSLKDLGCEQFLLPNVINVFTVPEYLKGYEVPEHELTEDQQKFIRRMYTARSNVLSLDDKRTSTKERELYRNPPPVVSPETARIYLQWAKDYETEQSLFGKDMNPEETQFVRYLEERAK